MLIPKLNNNLIYFVILIITLCCSNVSAQSTYAGINAIYSKLSFKKYYGGNTVSHKFTPGASLLIGHMFNNHFGLEIGYEIEKKTRKIKTIYNNETAFGADYDGPDNYNTSFNTTVKQRHQYAGITTKTNFLNNYNFISLMLGVTKSNITVKAINFADDQGLLDAEDVEYYNKTKFINIIKIIIEHKFNNKFGLNIFGSWKNTSRFNKISASIHPVANVRPKDCFNFGLGGTCYL